MSLLFFNAIAFLAIGALVERFVFSRIVVCIDDSLLAPRYPEMAFIFAMMTAFFMA